MLDVGGRYRGPPTPGLEVALLFLGETARGFIGRFPPSNPHAPIVSACGLVWRANFQQGGYRPRLGDRLFRHAVNSAPDLCRRKSGSHRLNVGGIFGVFEERLFTYRPVVVVAGTTTPANFVAEFFDSSSLFDIDPYLVHLLHPSLSVVILA